MTDIPWDPSSQTANKKSLKAIGNQKNLKHTLTPSKFREDKTQGVSKCKNKRCGVCKIIVEGNPIPLKTPKQHSSSIKI